MFGDILILITIFLIIYRVFGLQKKPKVIVVDGIIGSGKSTFIEFLEMFLTKHGYKVGVIPEPVEEWKKIGILGSFYEDMKRWAYSFQTFTFVSRLSMVEKMTKDSNYDIVIMERSPISDTFFFEILREDGNISPMEEVMYWDWWKMWTKLFTHKISAFFYVNTNVNISMDRVSSIGRKEESSLSFDYQQRLYENHEDYFGKEIFIDNVYVPKYKFDLSYHKRFIEERDGDRILNIIKSM